ncbi:MAG: PAS domain-containing protein [Polyangiales bacterium]
MTEAPPHPDAGSSDEVSGSFLRNILEHVAHPIFVKDRSFRFVLVNDALVRMVSIPKERLLGATDYDLFPAHEADHFRAKDQEIFDRGEIIEVVEERLTDSVGTVHVLATTKVPLRTENGAITHLVGIVHDITALTRAREDLRQRNELLESYLSERASALELAQQELLRRQRLALIGHLSGGFAHQVRNPLATISNATYLLRLALGKNPDPDVQRSLAIIDDEVRRANRIVTDLVDYARVGPARRRSCALGYTVGQAQGGVAVPEGVEVEYDVPETCEVCVDAEQVQRAICNLLRNAVMAAQPAGRVSVSAREDGDWVLLEVTDSGEGLPEDVRMQFDHPDEETRPTGVGIGLLTARALLENQGGALRYERAPAGGSRFIATLPRR